MLFEEISGISRPEGAVPSTGKEYTSQTCMISKVLEITQL